jgi:hypothetical protein
VSGWDLASAALGLAAAGRSFVSALSSEVADGTVVSLGASTGVRVVGDARGLGLFELVAVFRVTDVFDLFALEDLGFDFPVVETEALERAAAALASAFSRSILSCVSFCCLRTGRISLKSL